jgi:hypothetical protein
VVEGFLVWASKPVALVSWFGPQNQVAFGLLIAPQNRWREVGVGHTLRFSSLLCLKACLGRVFQSGLKTGGGVMMSGV